MLLFGHVLVLALSLAACQLAEPDGDPQPAVTTKPPVTTTQSATTEPLVTEGTSVKPPVEFTFISKRNGSLALKIKVVKEECTETMKELEAEEPSTDPLGTTIENPVNSCSDVYESGGYFMNSSEPFKVYCDVDEKTACLKQNLNQSELTHLAISLQDKTWLSHYTDDFNTKLLYNQFAQDNSLTDSPIKYLLSTKQIKSVNHVIKYYYSNGNSTKYEDAKQFSLAYSLWNGQTFEKGSKTPVKLTSSKTKCWDGDDEAGNTKWVCHDIILEDNSNRQLPVTDVYIGELVGALVGSSDPTPKIFFALHNFCIRYK